MKSLVIYFAHTGENYMENGIRNIEVGNTEKAANIIKNYTNADIFKVETLKEYPYNYYECCDVAKKELEQNELPEIKNKLTDVSNYNVIYIGGPVWWGHYPKAIDKALEDVRTKDTGEIPMHIRNAPAEGMSQFGYGVGYKYPHIYPGHVVEQQYLPDKMLGTKYFIKDDTVE